MSASRLSCASPAVSASRTGRPLVSTTACISLVSAAPNIPALTSRQGFRNNPGSLAMLTAIRRASSSVSNLAAERLAGHPRNLVDCAFCAANGPCVRAKPRSVLESFKLELRREAAGGRHTPMTSSALTISVCGIVRPSAFAALRFRISLNFVGCSTGRSAGFAPLSISSVYIAARRK